MKEDRKDLVDCQARNKHRHFKVLMETRGKERLLTTTHDQIATFMMATRLPWLDQERQLAMAPQKRRARSVNLLISQGLEPTV
jgi:hypothetical protein